MINFTGNERQENKITELGELAHHIVPKVEVRAFKGAFRFGVKSALEKNGLMSWSDMAERKLKRKEHFLTIF